MKPTSVLEPVDLAVRLGGVLELAERHCDVGESVEQEGVCVHGWCLSGI